MSQDDSQIWHEAMKIKMEKLKDIGTWELVELPKERMAIRCRWVFAAKTKPEGKFDTARARVVAQGFTQRPGMDYFEVTAPVVKFDSL